MTPDMLRGFARVAFLAALAIAAIWLLQAIGLADLIDDPFVGIIVFGLVSFVLDRMARKGDADVAKRSGRLPL